MRPELAAVPRTVAVLAVAALGALGGAISTLAVPGSPAGAAAKHKAGVALPNPCRLLTSAQVVAFVGGSGAPERADTECNYLGAGGGTNALTIVIQAAPTKPLTRADIQHDLGQPPSTIPGVGKIAAYVLNATAAMGTGSIVILRNSVEAKVDFRTETPPLSATPSAVTQLAREVARNL
jgi:hypothetical protein